MFGTPVIVTATVPRVRYVGPVLRGELGDLVVITFRNMVTQTTANLTVHPHGLFYTKSHEGNADSGLTEQN